MPNGPSQLSLDRSTDRQTPIQTPQHRTRSVARRHPTACWKRKRRRGAGRTYRLLVPKELPRVEEFAADARDDLAVVLDLGALVEPVAHELERDVFPVRSVLEEDFGFGACGLEIRGGWEGEGRVRVMYP